MGKGGQPQLLLELPAPTILVIKGRLGGWGGVEHGTKLRLGYTENKLTCLLGILFIGLVTLERKNHGTFVSSSSSSVTLVEISSDHVREELLYLDGSRSRHSFCWLQL